MSHELSLPTRTTGHQSPAAKAAFEVELAVWCDGIRQLNCSLDFKVSSRGWCYILEEHGLSKGDFDKAENLINACRKSGMLPLDICAEDVSHDFAGLEKLDDSDPEEEAAAWVYSIQTAFKSYTPFSFWDDQPYYIQLMVEKVDLRSLFSAMCETFRIPIANAKGWSDLNSRAAMMRRFCDAEARGQQPVLLYCGDHDPAGLLISDSLRSNMADLAEVVGWHPEHLIIDRFGLNRDLIDRLGLTWIDGLKTGSKKGMDLADPDHADYKKPYVQTYLAAHGARKVEANVLVTRPDEGRALLHRTITKYLPMDAPMTYQTRLAAPREELRLALLRAVTEMAAPGPDAN